MRIITGAILIAGAIWLFTSALPYCNTYGNMTVMIKLALILAALTAILGMFYLFAGSVEAKENARWYQFTIKSLLAITVMVALFFSGRAMGLRESTATYSPFLSVTPYPSSAAPLPLAPPPGAVPGTTVIEGTPTFDPYAAPGSTPSPAQAAPATPTTPPASQKP
jgi:hypothetical protein